MCFVDYFYVVSAFVIIKSNVVVSTGSQSIIEVI